MSVADEELKGTYRTLTGFQPEGQMTWVILHRDLPGFPDDNTLQINFLFPDGIQTVTLTPDPYLLSYAGSWGSPV